MNEGWTKTWYGRGFVIVDKLIDFVQDRALCLLFKSNAGVLA